MSVKSHIVYMYVYVCMCVYVCCMYVYICLCMYVCVCMYVFSTCAVTLDQHTYKNDNN